MNTEDNDEIWQDNIEDVDKTKLDLRQTKLKTDQPDDIKPDIIE